MNSQSYSCQNYFILLPQSYCLESSSDILATTSEHRRLKTGYVYLRYVENKQYIVFGINKLPQLCNIWAAANALDKENYNADFGNYFAETW